MRSESSRLVGTELQLSCLAYLGKRRGVRMGGVDLVYSCCFLQDVEDGDRRYLRCLWICSAIDSCCDWFLFMRFEFVVSERFVIQAKAKI